MSKNIRDFKIGDSIVRVEPAKPYSPVRKDIFGQISGGLRDRSYMGEKVIFKGIANGLIYVERTDGTQIKLFGLSNSLALDIFDEGWEEWVDIFNLTEGNFHTNNSEDGDYILNKIEEYLKNENFEMLNKIKNKING